MSPPKKPLFFNPVQNTKNADDLSRKDKKHLFQLFKKDMWSKLPKGYHTRNRTIKSLWEQKKQEVFNKENCQDQSIDANHQYIYECYMCNKKADRKKVVFCGICQNWIHSDCAKFDASLAQKVPIFCCVSCIRSTFGPFCNYIAFRKKRADLLQRKEAAQIRKDWNLFNESTKKSWEEYYPFQKYGNQIGDQDFTYSLREIENRHSNCWLNAVVHALNSTPLLLKLNSIIEMSDDIDNIVWKCAKNVFQELRKAGTALLLDSVMQLASYCGFDIQGANKLGGTADEDCADFYNQLFDEIEKVTEKTELVNDLIETFGHQLVVINKCLKCNLFKVTETIHSRSLTIPVIDIDCESLPICSMIWHKFTSELSGQADAICTKCKRSSIMHQFIAFLEVPEILVIFLGRNAFDQTHSTVMVQTPVDIEEQIDLSNIMIGTEKRPPLLYTFVSAIEKRGSKVECGHFVSYFHTSHNTVMMYDDHLVSQKSLQKLFNDPVFKRGVYIVMYKRGHISQQSIELTFHNHQQALDSDSSDNEYCDDDFETSLPNYEIHDGSKSATRKFHDKKGKGKNGEKPTFDNLPGGKDKSNFSSSGVGENRNSKSHPQRKEIPNSLIDHGLEAETEKGISGYKETSEDKPENISKQQIDRNANPQHIGIITTSAESQSTKSTDKLRDSSLDTPIMDLGKSSADALNLGNGRKRMRVHTDATASKKP